MSPATIFQIQMILGYVPWLLCFTAFIWPWLKQVDHFEAQRGIAVLHSFRFYGLVFLLPGVVGQHLPEGFATTAAYGDFATGVLAMMALATARTRPLFWFFVVAFNLVGVADLGTDYFLGTLVGLPAIAGELGGTYAILMLYVPLLMITHAAAFYLLVRSAAAQARGAAA